MSVRDIRHLTKAEQVTFAAGLAQPHPRQISLEVLKLNGDSAGMLGLSSIDGQVSFTRGSDTEVSRVLTMSAKDDRLELDFTPSSPGQTVYFDRMLRVHDARYIPALGWVSSAEFTGPLWTFKRRGYGIELTAHSRERRCMRTLWEPAKLQRGMHKVDAIRRLLHLCGITDDWINFPNLPLKGNKLPERKSLHRFTNPWAVAQKIARSMNRQLYCDGWGIFHLRRLPETVAFTFKAGDGGTVLSDPEVNRTLEGFHNVWLVLGKKPKGSKERTKAIVRIEHGDSLSPGDLGESPDDPYVLAEKVEDNSLRSDRECRAHGEHLRAEAIRATVEAAFQSGPVCGLTPGDLAELETKTAGTVAFRMWEWTNPLIPTPEGATIGKVRRTPRRRGRGG